MRPDRYYEECNRYVQPKVVSHTSESTKKEWIIIKEISTKLEARVTFLAWKKGSNASSANASCLDLDIPCLSGSLCQSEDSSPDAPKPKKLIRKLSWLWSRCNRIGSKARSNLKKISSNFL